MHAYGGNGLCLNAPPGIVQHDRKVRFSDRCLDTPVPKCLLTTAQPQVMAWTEVLAVCCLHHCLSAPVPHETWLYLYVPPLLCLPQAVRAAVLLRFGGLWRPQGVAGAGALGQRLGPRGGRGGCCVEQHQKGYVGYRCRHVL